MFRDFTKYEVFETGRIWSYSKNRFLKPRKTNRTGYYQFSLSDNNGNKKNYLVHRVVYEAIKGEIPQGMEINHISERKDENAIWNLELVDRKTNINYGSRNARCSEKQRNDPKKSKPVAAYKNNVLVMVFPSTREAKRQGFDQSHVSACCRNCYLREGNNIYKGYQWIYYEESPPLFIDVA